MAPGGGVGERCVTNVVRRTTQKSQFFGFGKRAGVGRDRCGGLLVENVECDRVGWREPGGLLPVPAKQTQIPFSDSSLGRLWPACDAKWGLPVWCSGMTGINMLPERTQFPAAGFRREGGYAGRLTKQTGGTNPIGRRSLRREGGSRSEEHTSELQSPCNLVCRLL